MKTKQIDETAGRIGLAMQAARRTHHLKRNDVAELLRITPHELVRYENGTDKVPFDILQRIFVHGYKAIQMRSLESKYHHQRCMFRKMKEYYARKDAKAKTAALSENCNLNTEN